MSVTLFATHRLVDVSPLRVHANPMLSAHRLCGCVNLDNAFRDALSLEESNVQGTQFASPLLVGVCRIVRVSAALIQIVILPKRFAIRWRNVALKAVGQQDVWPH